MSISLSAYVMYGPARRTAVFCIGSLVFLSCFYLFGVMNALWHRPLDGQAILYWMKTGIETIACGYAVFYLTVACTYRRPGIRDGTTRSQQYYPNVAIAYLCCDDLDGAALSNIAAVCEKYQSRLIVHDDSGSEENRARVDRLVGDIADQHAHPIRLLRRPVKNGGKPGAVNHIVGQLLPDVEFLLICDSDSHLPTSDFLEDALSHFQSPDVALVQFHNRGHIYTGDRRPPPAGSSGCRGFL